MEGAPPPDPPSYGATNIPLPDKHHMVTKHTMRDFIGLESADEEARKAMMNFSYLSAIGNMDEAFKAIKLIKRFVTAFDRWKRGERVGGESPRDRIQQ